MKEKANFRMIYSYGTDYIKNIQLSPRAAIPEAGALDLGCNKTVSRSHCSYRKAQEQQQDPGQPKINALTKSINQDERKFTKSKDATHEKDRTVTNLCIPNNLKS